MQLNGNCIYALSHYLIHRTAQAPSRLNSEQIRQLDAFLAQKYPLLYSFCLQILETLGQKLDLEPRRIDILLLALWLHKQGANSQKTGDTCGDSGAWLCHRQQYRQRRQPVIEKYDF